MKKTAPELNRGIPITRIRPIKGWVPIRLGELWVQRELLYFFVWRDIKVRYKQTLLGLAWTILVPLANTVVFTVVFGKLAKLPTDGLPEPVFYMAGLVIWKYFASALTSASGSLVNSSGLLTKIYFPRLFLPISTCITGLVDFFIAFSALLLLVLYYQILPALTILLLPLLLVVAMGTALGVGLFFAALNVRYRDVGVLVPFVVQIWMYCSVIVPFSMIPDEYGNWRYLYGINPMAGVIEGLRWSLMPGTLEAPWILIGIGAVAALSVLFWGLYYFKRMEEVFADIV